MKIFQAFQRNFKWMHISADRVPFGLNEIKHALTYTVCIMSFYIYLLNEAKTGRQQMKSMTIIAAIFLLFIAHFSYRFNSQKIFKFVHELEQNINESEFEKK